MSYLDLTQICTNTVTKHANITSVVSSSFGVMYRKEALAISGATANVALTKLVS